MRFNLIGTLEFITDDGRTHTPSAPKLCQVLAVLLLRADSVVSVDLLIQELWGDSPPSSAMTTLQTYIYHSRRMFEQTGVTSADGPRLCTQMPGYRIKAAAAEIDVVEYERLVRESRALLDRGQPEAASQRLREAAAVWRGPVLAGITLGSVLLGHVAHLDELRIRAIETRIEADQQLGRTRETVPELRALVAAYPLNEWFHARLIFALGSSGRRVEALNAYDDLRRLLHKELGLEPGPELARIKQEILGSPVAPVPLSLVDASGRVKPRRRTPFWS
ncbi:BTAD domain-containing putative transcriptional regulator [Streptomyces sp. NPDC047097]|uniref:AfsR/SARP family transcriptional regulator n=1 Tax=Streptomyces sp. NPDC047097 TaxID=3155260 RepID=UPI00340BACF2